MSRPTELTRRRFLAAAVACAGTICAARPWGSVGSATPALGTGWTGMLEPTESARAVGRAYLDATPGEQSTELLLDALIASLPEADGELEPAFLALIREDFACERVVRLEGWVLSRTEARLCALATLSAA